MFRLVLFRIVAFVALGPWARFTARQRRLTLCPVVFQRLFLLGLLLGAALFESDGVFNDMGQLQPLNL